MSDSTPMSDNGSSSDPVFELALRFRARDVDSLASLQCRDGEVGRLGAGRIISPPTGRREFCAVASAGSEGRVGAEAEGSAKRGRLGTGIAEDRIRASSGMVPERWATARISGELQRGIFRRERRINRRHLGTTRVLQTLGRTSAMRQVMLSRIGIALNLRGKSISSVFMAWSSLGWRSSSVKHLRGRWSFDQFSAVP